MLQLSPELKVALRPDPRWHPTTYRRKEEITRAQIHHLGPLFRSYSSHHDADHEADCRTR